MPRLIFTNDSQKTFLQLVRVSSGLSNEELAQLCEVSGRTFRDWVRGKYNISKSAAQSLSEKFSVPIPENTAEVNDYWYVNK
ncbi:MAG: hypothetical protein A2782_04660 [Candidatus Blackburnbacteria bacterium RIFCSPHIGHO2_01_FULL_43_15b]|uniref:HTH cro/C1-type domain-containing protein n=1 Tax=Candidatus Blackburnbacteria bacterium RIFCSPHIGHO2_01_FULL_43_15b TaxID=1797513 RepID=A0A1G1V3K9_9BACT|nr:MAG: hypothetical protein A2782_04660 [Candidatus Blackburnbacteria bacterium RIFCSPHIGHO2_01_FULL_43_15b]